MKTYNKFKCILLSILFGGSMLLLGGCNAALLDPKGTIALKEMHLLVGSTLLMLIVVIPVILMSFFF
ncbi:MAG: cytochrome ubiquinol oxidase subunit II, partial [Gammaproteobacteria bacterium]|nr:cytochrome ubiquinol oxidase subunit II [Gammaproteobacteria bacterium]